MSTVLLLALIAVSLLIGIAYLVGDSDKRCIDCECFHVCPLMIGLSPILPCSMKGDSQHDQLVPSKEDVPLRKQV